MVGPIFSRKVTARSCWTRYSTPPPKRMGTKNRAGPLKVTQKGRSKVPASRELGGDREAHLQPDREGHPHHGGAVREVEEQPGVEAEGQVELRLVQQLGAEGELELQAQHAGVGDAFLAVVEGEAPAEVERGAHPVRQVGGDARPAELAPRTVPRRCRWSVRPGRTSPRPRPCAAPAAPSRGPALRASRRLLERVIPLPFARRPVWVPAETTEKCRRFGWPDPGAPLYSPHTHPQDSGREPPR